MVVAFLLMSQWTLASGWSEIIPPQAIRGIAMGAMFVPLSTATLRSLPGPLIAKGAGLFNLFRQLGGSLGVAIPATTLDRRTDVHRVGLADQLSPLDPVAAQRPSTAWPEASRRAVSTPKLRAWLPRLPLITCSQPRRRWRSSTTFMGCSLLIFVLMLPLGMMIARHAPGKYAPLE